MRDRLPSWFQAPPTPRATRPVRVDETTTPRQLVLGVVGSVRRYTVPAAALSVLHQLGEALVPVLMGVAIDRALTTGDPAQLALWLVVLAADFALLSFSYRFGSRIGLIGMLTAQHRLRMQVVTRVLSPTGRAQLPGAAVTLAIADVARVASAVLLVVFPIGQLAAIVFGAIALLWLAWPIGLAVLVGAPVVLWLSGRLSAPLHRRGRQEQDAAAAASARAADILHGYRVIRGLGAERAAVDRYRTANDEALRRARRARASEGLFLAGTGAMTGLFVVGIGVAAALTAASGALSVGAFIAIVGLTQFLLSPLESVAQRFGTTWAAATSSADRLLTVLRDDTTAQASAEATAPAEPLDETAPFAVEELRAGPHPPITARVRPGEIMAIDADARTTAALARVLAGRASPHAGRIRLGSRVLAAADSEPDRVRESDGSPLPGVLVAPHEAHLFSGSVMDNVRADGASVARALDALSAAGCDDLRTSLPLGYDSPVGERGNRLSGGQRQRVALARALAADSPVLVLHEPVTSVDTVTELRIAERLGDAGGRRRIVVLSRSAALRSQAHQVVERQRPERPAPDGTTPNGAGAATTGSAQPGEPVPALDGSSQ